MGRRQRWRNVKMLPDVSFPFGGLLILEGLLTEGETGGFSTPSPLPRKRQLMKQQFNVGAFRLLPASCKAGNRSGRIKSKRQISEMDRAPTYPSELTPK